MWATRLPKGRREEKFGALAKLRLGSKTWIECPAIDRAPFLPASTGAWSTFPKLEDLFLYNGSGVMPGRTWIIAPDGLSLQDRWRKLIEAPLDEKRILFHAHMRAGEPGDKHADKVVSKPLARYANQPLPISLENGSMNAPQRDGCRSFDRQWIIPDARLINQPNPELWESRSQEQTFLTALSRTSPSNGPALTFTALVPDLDHYNGRGGRVLHLWSDFNATKPNLKLGLLEFLSQRYGETVSATDLMAYIAGISAHPAYTARFQEDLSTPGLRIPITADFRLFTRSVEIGSRILWLHTFGERMADPKYERPHQPPRLPIDRRPSIPKEGLISEEPEEMPDTLTYDAGKHRLLVGHGYIDHVTPAMWA